MRSISGIISSLLDSSLTLNQRQASQLSQASHIGVYIVMNDQVTATRSNVELFPLPLSTSRDNCEEQIHRK